MQQFKGHEAEAELKKAADGLRKISEAAEMETEEKKVHDDDYPRR